MAYIDGFVVPVPKENIEAYKELASRSQSSGANTAPSTTRSGSPTT